MEWQPIETAPKDGTRVDIWTVDQDGVGRRYTEARFERARGGYFARDGWCGWGIGYDDLDYCEDPPRMTPAGKTLFETATHWMPMPAAPKNVGGEEE